MYKPPENSNRVKAMKLKFESQDTKSKINDGSAKQKNAKPAEFVQNAQRKDTCKEKNAFKSNSANSETNQLPQQILNRQLSDPIKRNIKRTPAFRLDKNTFIEREHVFQRQASQSSIKSKLDKFNSLDDNSRLKENCDNMSNINNNLTAKNSKLSSSNSIGEIKSKLYCAFDQPKPNSTANLNLRDNLKNIQLNQSVNSTSRAVYAEPIPKSLRNQPVDKPKCDSSLDIEPAHKTPAKSEKCNTIETAQNVIEILKDQQLNGTDTIKTALKRPLPPGPAPKKPPRTFQHSPQGASMLKTSSKSETNIASLNLDCTFTKKLDSALQSKIAEGNAKGKRDPKYMLDKLESALKNNRILQRQPKVDVPSDEENDLMKPKCKSSCSSPLFRRLNNSCTLSTSNKNLLNCLPSLGCSRSTYARIREPNASFFVDRKEEPVYAEPFQYSPAEEQPKKINSQQAESPSNRGTVRNSLYYMSSPVLGLVSGDLQDQPAAMEPPGGKEQVNSSETTFLHITSVSNPNLSSPEDSSSVGNDVKHIIRSFEDRCKSHKGNTTNTPLKSPPEKLDTSKRHLPRALDKGSQRNAIICNKACETSSISTISTSDTDSNLSSPVDSNTVGNNIKNLIKSFEDRNVSGESDNVTGTSVTIKQSASDGHVLTPSEKLKELDNHLQGTLHKDGRRNGIVCTDEQVSESVEDKKAKCVSKFETYVKTVRVFSVKKMDNNNLFHCCLLVGLDGQCPYIKLKFPKNITVPPYIEKFCFPDSEDHRVNYSSKEQCYSLVITDASGDRIYGYCRRVLPEGSCSCLPLAYCILTKNRAPRFYKRILQELEHHHGLPDKQRDLLVNEFYKLKFPRPGHSIKIDLSKIIHCEVKYFDLENANGVNVKNNNAEERNSNDSDTLNDYFVIKDLCTHGLLKNATSSGESESNVGVCPLCSKGASSELVLTLHQDVRYEETDLKELCETLDIVLLQKVFENLLVERKIIFVSRHLSKLSSCIEAIQGILYPFSWPHAFIPVLPKSRWEIVEAPAPLICGVLSVEVVNEYKIENGIVVDLDAKEVLQDIHDDAKILPESSVKSWKKGLQLASCIPTAENERNVLLSDAFIRVFICTCGHYKNFISNGVFDREGFKSFPKGKGTKRFLQWFTQTNMFELFVDSVLTNSDSFYIFDSRIHIYSSQDTTTILEKMKDWKKD